MFKRCPANGYDVLYIIYCPPPLTEMGRARDEKQDLLSPQQAPSPLRHTLCPSTATRRGQRQSLWLLCTNVQVPCLLSAFADGFATCNLQNKHPPMHPHLGSCQPFTHPSGANALTLYLFIVMKDVPNESTRCLYLAPTPWRLGGACSSTENYTSATSIFSSANTCFGLFSDTVLVTSMPTTRDNRKHLQIYHKPTWATYPAIPLRWPLYTYSPPEKQYRQSSTHWMSIIPFPATTQWITTHKTDLRIPEITRNILEK